MSKNRVLSKALALITVAGLLAGCNGGSAESPAGTEESGGQAATESAENPTEAQTGLSEPVTIVLWHSMTDDAGGEMEKYVQEFNSTIGAEQGITVESIFQGSYSDSTTKMRTILQNDLYDQLPDVMQIDATGIVDYKASEYAYTVDDALRNDPGYDLGQIVNAPLKAWNYDNRQLGMPFSSSTTVMYYNKTLLDDAGVLEPPTTFEEIIAASEQLPAQNNDGVDLVAYAQIPNTPTLANWIGQIPGNGYDSSYIVNNRNGRDGDATELVCDQEGTLLAFLTEWKHMYDAGALSNIGDNLSDMFFAGQLAFYTTSTANLNTILTSVDGRFEVGCSYFPRINEASNYGATVSGSAMFMFQKQDDRKAEAAWEFLKFLASPEIQARFSVSTGYFPIHQGAYDTETYKDYVAQYPQMEIGVNQVEMTSEDLMGVAVGPSYDFYMEVQNYVSDMLVNDISPEDTVAMMSDTLNGLLDQYNRANQ